MSFPRGKISFSTGSGPVHPNAHIVLADSYGWSYYEPANYLGLAVAELQSMGETNVSWVSWPWLWSQNHAVIEEHAGFANILAPHIAAQLGLPAPPPNDLSSFAGPGKISDTGFEIVPLGLNRQNQASGWRQKTRGREASGTIVTDAARAHSGSRLAQLIVGTDSGSVSIWQATDIVPGKNYSVSGFAKGLADATATVSLRVEFKDQAQKTISTSAGDISLTKRWTSYSSSAVAPANAWSVNVYLQLDGTNATAQFDDVALSSE